MIGVVQYCAIMRFMILCVRRHFVMSNSPILNKIVTVLYCMKNGTLCDVYCEVPWISLFQPTCMQLKSVLDWTKKKFTFLGPFIMWVTSSLTLRTVIYFSKALLKFLTFICLYGAGFLDIFWRSCSALLSCNVLHSAYFSFASARAEHITQQVLHIIQIKKVWLLHSQGHK